MIKEKPNIACKGKEDRSKSTSYRQVSLLSIPEVMYGRVIIDGMAVVAVSED